MEVLRSMYLTFRIVYSMAASGSNLGNDDFVEVVTPSPVSDVDTRMTAILEQLVRSNEQMAKSHEAQMGMQA